MEREIIEQPEQPNKDQKETKQGNDNLSNDNVNVGIKPETDNNKVSINLCSFVCLCYVK